MSAATHHDPIPTPPHGARGSAGRPARFDFFRWLGRGASTAAVVAALAGVAAWGHYNDWKMPKFSELVGSSPAAVEVWCDAHGVAEAACIECLPELLPPLPDFGWCAEHGVPQCPLEHPEVAQLKATPAITEAMRQRAGRALALRPRPENNSLCKLYRSRIQFTSAAAVEKAGVDIAVVVERPIVEAIPANGEVTYDQTRMAHLSSRVAGSVWRVEKQVGDRVAKGELLALVDAAEVGKAKAELLQSIAQLRLKEAAYEQARPLGNGAIPLKQIRELDAAVQEARIRLQSAQQALVNLGLAASADDFRDVDTSEIARRIQFLGVPETMVASLDAGVTTSNLFPILSPLHGVVIDRHLVAGEVVDTSDVLFAVADVSQMWLALNVREEDAPLVALGQKVLFQPGSDTTPVEGAVGWISTAADDKTRTIQVRAQLPNEDGRLRANTFGVGRIVLREEPKAVVVPSEALHWDGTCDVVFVRDKRYHEPDSPKFFHIRTVRVGVKTGEQTEIIAGLLPGEVVASKNSVVLKGQLLKSGLGDGCADHHH
jgi:cobalt-zinc-cadmium efflux system membrane fusion protein